MGATDPRGAAGQALEIVVAEKQHVAAIAQLGFEHIPPWQRAAGEQRGGARREEHGHTGDEETTRPTTRRRLRGLFVHGSARGLSRLRRREHHARSSTGGRSSKRPTRRCASRQGRARRIGEAA